MACVLVVGPFAYAFQLKTGEEEGARMASDNRRPIVRLAIMTTDLDEDYRGRALVEGELAEVVLTAHPAATDRKVKGQTVLVFFNTTRDHWRFVSGDISQVTHQYSDLGWLARQDNAQAE